MTNSSLCTFCKQVQAHFDAFDRPTGGQAFLIGSLQTRGPFLNPQHLPYTNEHTNAGNTHEFFSFFFILTSYQTLHIPHEVLQESTVQAMSSSPVSISPSARVNTSSLPSSSSSPSRRRVGIRVRSPTGPLDGLPTPSPFNHPHRHRQLPLELYNEIAQYHTKHRSTLLSLCLTSRDLSRIAQPYLFRNIDPKDVNKVEFLRVVAGEPEEEESEEDKGDSGEEEEMRSEGEHEDSGMDGEERVSKSRVEKGKGKLKDEPIPNPQICQPSRATLRRREKESSEWLAGLVQRISVHRREDDRFDKQEKGVEGVEAEINYWRLLGLAMSKMKNLRAFAFTSYEPPKIIFQAKAALSHSELPKPASPATHGEGAGDATATHLEEILPENAHLTAGRSGSVIDNGGENTEPETVNIFKDCSFEKLQCIHWICSSDLGLFEFLQTSPLPALRVLHLGKCSYHLSLPSDVLPNLRECRATTCFLKNILKSHSNIDEVQWLLSCGPLGEESLAELRDPLKRIKTLSVSGRGVCAFLTRALSAMTRLECLKLRIQSNCVCSFFFFFFYSSESKLMRLTDIPSSITHRPPSPSPPRCSQLPASWLFAFEDREPIYDRQGALRCEPELANHRHANYWKDREHVCASDQTGGGDCSGGG